MPIRVLKKPVKNLTARLAPRHVTVTDPRVMIWVADWVALLVPRGACKAPMEPLPVLDRAALRRVLVDSGLELPDQVLLGALFFFPGTGKIRSHTHMCKTKGRGSAKPENPEGKKH